MNNTNHETPNKISSFYARVPADTNLYLVDIGKESFRYGEEVLIKTEFGRDLAVITSFLFTGKETKKSYSSGTMLRYPTENDRDAKVEQSEHSKKFKATISNMALKLNLKMNITHVLVPVYGKTIVVYYLAKGRVDFRELLKSLRTELKQKVIFRQISPQERKDSFALDCRIP